MGVKKGTPSFWKGKTFSKEYRKKLSVAHKGQRPSDFAIEKARQIHLGKPSGMLGKKWSLEQREKMEIYKGTNNWNWKGGNPNCLDCNKKLSRRDNKTSRCIICAGLFRRLEITKANERHTAMRRREYTLWRTAVFIRDDYTCMFCGDKDIYLEADHIKRWALYPELRYAIDNGRTLCKPCHMKTDTYPINLRGGNQN